MTYEYFDKDNEGNAKARKNRATGQVEVKLRGSWLDLINVSPRKPLPGIPMNPVLTLDENLQAAWGVVLEDQG